MGKKKLPVCRKFLCFRLLFSPLPSPLLSLRVCVCEVGREEYLGQKSLSVPLSNPLFCMCKGSLEEEEEDCEQPLNSHCRALKETKTAQPPHSSHIILLNVALQNFNIFFLQILRTFGFVAPFSCSNFCQAEGEEMIRKCQQHPFSSPPPSLLTFRDTDSGHTTLR